MKALLSAAFTLLLVAIPAFVSNAGSGPPSSYKLLQYSDLFYEGAFRLPDGAFGTPSGNGFAFGDNKPLTYNPVNNSLYISGYDNLTAEISIPTPVAGSTLSALNTATVLHTFFDAYEGKRMQVNPSDTNGIRVGGHLFYGNNLYLSSFSWYDGAASQSTSHFIRPPNLNTSGSVSGPYRIGTLNPGYYSGYMTLIPSEWQSALGGNTLVGNCCLSIISRTSYGPAAFSVNIENLGSQNPLNAIPLVYYDSSHQNLGDWGSSGTHFNGTSEVKGIVLPSPSRSLIFFGRHGTGTFCYGTGSTCADLASGYEGTHAYPYVYYAWVYDVKDLVAAKNGTKNPWDVLPYAYWTFSFPFADKDSHIQGAAYDPSSQRIFLTQAWGDGALAVIYVFSVNASSVNRPAAVSNLRIVQ